jgi:hypothetical protein
MVKDFFSILRERILGPEPALARAWQAEMAERLTRAAREERLRFERTLSADPSPGHVVIARARRTDGTPFWVGMPVEQFLSMHTWVTGATGSGKSYLVLGVLLQVLATETFPTVVLDMKGELASLLLDLVVPTLVDSSPGQELLDNLRVIRPFDREYVPELRITLPETGTDREVQAYMIADSLVEGLGADLGARMSRICHKLVSLAIERNEPLTVVRTWLERPAFFSRCARESSDPTIRAYARGAFMRENQSSLDALLARLDEFLFLPATRLALSASRCLSFPECLERGLTIIDLGNPPAGAERVARFWGGVLVGRLMRAILSREVRKRSPQVCVVFEEFQETLAGRQAEQFGRLLALARHKRVALTFVNQQTAQLDPTLVRLLRTNCGMEAIFRCNLEDARAVAHALPVPLGRGQREEERQALLEELVRMPTRTFHLWLKEMPFRAVQVRSPRLDLASLEAARRRLSRPAGERIRQGVIARRIADFDVSSCEEYMDERMPNTDSLLFTDGEVSEDESRFPFLG